MKLLQDIYQHMKKLSPFSKGTLLIGLYLMTLCSILGTYTQYTAYHSGNYIQKMALSRLFFEAAPACLAAAACAAFLCDCIEKQYLRR